MNFKIENKEILPILTAIGKIINPKCPMAIMRDFLFRRDGDNVYVMATDGENTVEKLVPVLTVEGAEPFCIDGKWLLNLLRKMGNKVVTINSSAENIVVSHNSGSYDFPADDASDFPKEIAIQTYKTISLGCRDLSDGIDHALISVSEETIRPILCGVLLDFEKDCLTFVSSDTHILTRYRNRKYSFDIENNIQAVLPTKAARLLTSILPSEGKVDILLSEQRIKFSGDGYTLACALAKGQFPAYNRVIPSVEGSTEIIIDREELKSSLQRLDICTDNEYSRVIMEADMTGVALKCSNIEYRVSANEVIIADVTGVGRRISYTSGFVTSWLDIAGTKLVRVNIVDENRPIVLRPGEDKENIEWVAIVMPLQIVE